MDHEYVRLTADSFRKHLGSLKRHDIFASHEDLEKRFCDIAAEAGKKKRRKFPTSFGVVTEHLSPLAILGLRSVAVRGGYRILEATHRSRELEYIGSDHGGHYSTDYYRILRYDLVVFQKRNGKRR